MQTFDPNALPVIQFGILASGASLEDVGIWAQNDLEPVLQRVDGVANIQLDGAPQRQFQILLNPNRLEYYGFNPQQVTAAVAGSALNQSIGTVSKQGADHGTFSTAERAEGHRPDLLHPGGCGIRGIRVRDLGAVRDVPQPTTYARVDGQPVVLVSIQKTTDSNAVAVAQNVRSLLATTPLPAGYSIVISNDTTEPITASIRSTYRELIITAIVVAIVCLLFLGKLNTAFSVILAIPIALSAAPVLYKLAGFNFNQVSLLALIVAIGVVVDDSIVVAENVERYRWMGYALKESVLKGASEVFSAVVAASLSLIAVLLPVSFIGGFVGRYLMQFSLGLAAAVFFSLLEAVLFLTVRLAYTPDAQPHSFIQTLITAPHRAVEASLEWLRDRYANTLGAVLRRGGWILAGACVFFLGTVFLLGPRIPFSFVPQADSGVMQVNLRLAPGAPIDVTNEATGRAEAWLFNQPEVVSVQTTVGSNGTATFGSSPNISGMTVQLVPPRDRRNIFLLADEYRKKLLALMKDQPSPGISASAAGGLQGQGSRVSFTLSTSDFNALSGANQRALAWLAANPYVEDAASDLSETTLENDFVPDPHRLNGTGISPGALAEALQTYTSGHAGLHGPDWAGSATRSSCRWTRPQLSGPSRS